MLIIIIRTAISRSLKSFSKKLLDTSFLLDKLNSLTKQEKSILSRNSIFKDKHKGKRAFVIVNGPSLKRQNISLLEKEITFVVSGFWKHPVIDDWQPTYYSILDKTFFSGEENIRIFYSEINSKIKKSTFFIPLYPGYEANKKYKYLDPDKTFYIGSYGDPFPSVDLTSLVQGFQSVSAFALTQAIYMGCNPIYLLGYDHDYLAHRDVDHHFYDGCVIEGHKNGFTPISAMVSYDEEMESMLRLWKNYKSLKSVADSANIKIINATNGGYLDVFDRKNFEDIFKI